MIVSILDRTASWILKDPLIPVKENQKDWLSYNVFSLSFFSLFFSVLKVLSFKKTKIRNPAYTPLCLYTNGSRPHLIYVKYDIDRWLILQEWEEDNFWNGNVLRTPTLLYCHRVNWQYVVNVIRCNSGLFNFDLVFDSQYCLTIWQMSSVVRSTQTPMWLYSYITWQ